MDEIIKDVNEGWGEDDPSNPRGMKYVPVTGFAWFFSKGILFGRFKGSDDYLRSKVLLIQFMLYI